MGEENSEEKKGKPILVSIENHKKLFGIKIDKDFSCLDLAISYLFNEIDILKAKLEEKNK